MAHFTRTILRHSGLWTAPETSNKNLSGFPDAVLFNRNEGFEVLHFINRYMDYRGWYAEQTFQKIETIIKTRLPYAVRTHKDAQQWLDANFKM